MPRRPFLSVLVILIAFGAALRGQTGGRAWFSRPSSGEFLVNDDSLGGCDQSFPVIASSGKGGFVVAWADQRNGRDGNWGQGYDYRGIDVYFQLFDARGNPAGSIQKVNGHAVNLKRNSDHPVSAAMNGSGRFVIAWEGVRFDSGAKSDIYFQVFDEQGAAVGSNKKANADEGTDREECPTAAMDDGGRFIIAWEKMNESYSDVNILFRRFGAEGDPLGGNQRADDGAGRLWASAGGPCIAMDGSGRFAIAWEGCLDNGYDPDICFQRFDASAVPAGSAQTANDDTSHAGQMTPSIGMNRRGDFIIAWEDTRNNPGEHIDFLDIYFQRFDSLGHALGCNQMANDDTCGAGQYHPAAAAGDDGTAVIAWHDNRIRMVPEPFGVYFQRVDAGGNALGANRKADTGGGVSSQSFPHAASDPAGGFIVVWEDERNGARNLDVYCRRFDADGNARGASIHTGGDAGGSDQCSPAVAADGKGGFIVAWTDERNAYQYDQETYDIYFERYDAAGKAAGPNRKVNEAAGRITDPTTPAVAADADGNFVIAWMDNRVHSWDIYCQRFDASGRALGSNEPVNDDGNYDADQRSPAMAMNSRGDYVIAWMSFQGWDFGVRYQVFDSDGHRVGKIRAPYRAIGGDRPAVAMDESGRFVIAWWEDAYYDIDGVSTIISDVYMERFDAGGNSLGRSRKVNDAARGKRGGPSIAMNGSGEFVIAWKDGRDGSSHVYCQRYDSSGRAVGANKKADGDEGIAAPYRPAAVIHKDGRFVVAWSDERMETGSAMLAGQGFNPDGSRNGDNFFITGGPSERFPVAASNKDRILFAWQDNRRSKGFDVYAESAAWDDMTAVPDRAALPQRHGILPNYPDPFNPETIIPYRLNSRGRVKISICDITGRHVRDLADAEQEAGSHQVTWNGTDDRGVKVNSGVYFCRMRVESRGSVFQTTEKVCLVR
jgi:hypothetical protein